MKWKCTYQPGEKEEAAADLAALLRRHPGAKVRKSDRHPPFMHIYVTVPSSGPPAALRKGLDQESPLWYNTGKGTGVPPKG